MSSREKKDRLVNLRKLYIEKIGQLEIKLKELDPPTKSVHFNFEIENINDGGGISRSQLSHEEEGSPCHCCAYDRVECSLNNNTWQFKRKER